MPFTNSTIESVSDLIREHILPRLNHLDLELVLLRRVTWPICQALSETNQLDKMQEKYEFLKYLDPDEIKLLLKMKSNASLLDEEYHRIITQMKLS